MSIKQSTLNAHVNLEALRVYTDRLRSSAQDMAIGHDYPEDPSEPEQTAADILIAAHARMSEAIRLAAIAERLREALAYARIYDTAKKQVAPLMVSARAAMAPQTVHVVTRASFGEDEPAVFGREQDADTYARAARSGPPVALIVVDAALAAKMINEERRMASDDPDETSGRVPYGVAWPTLADGCYPPDGWTWVERDDEADVYPHDQAAAEALIAAGIGTEFGYFRRSDHTRMPAHGRGCSVAVNVPDTATVDGASEASASDDDVAAARGPSRNRARKRTRRG